MVSSKIHVLIAAAGSGTRFDALQLKQYMSIADFPVLLQSIKSFYSCGNISSLRVIIDPEHAQMYHEAVKGIDLPPPVNGGQSRSESVYNGLKSISEVKHDNLVLIHDAARPNIHPHDIQKIIDALRSGAKAATLATPVTETLRRGQDTIDRSGLWAVQTPQGFRYDVIMAAHEKFKDQNFTDDASMVSAMGTEVTIVPGRRSNIKLTEPDDFAMLEKLMNTNGETRTGNGFDVHAFDTVAGRRKLMLCGVAIDHPYGLVGHSDADVALHALTDAILGAIGAGDIGLHFPPSDMTFKDMDSAVFLEKSCAMMRAIGGSIINADLTIICEQPKIGPYREAMKSRIATITGTDAGRINIKATTTEGLGFTGRGEGIAAQATVSIKLP